MRKLRGTVLSGRSLRLEGGNPFTNFIFGDVGRRPAPLPDPTSEAHFLPGPAPLIAAVEGDLGFVGLGGFTFEPDGPVREMEIEVKGKNYDGQRLEWLVATGLSTNPPITNSIEAHAVLVFPRFGALARRNLVARAALRSQNLEFTGQLGSVSLIPSQYGAIHNDGNIPAAIVSAEKTGPQADEFMILFEHKGTILSWHDVQTRGPLVLLPGETLLIGGRFFPGAEAGPGDPAREALLEFGTNVPSSPTVAISVQGRTILQDAAAEVLPTILNFGVVRIDSSAPRTRNFVVLSVGRTPLLIHSISLEHPWAGFSWGVLQGGISATLATPGVRHQVDVGAALYLQVWFPAPGTPGAVTPVPVGLRQTRLIMQTNAGTFEVELSAHGNAS